MFLYHMGESDSVEVKNMGPRTVYVGMALTHAPTEFMSLKDELYRGLREMYLQPLEFVGLEGKTAKDVYQHDSNCTLNADFAIFVCDYPSTGLGIEIKTRLSAKKPMLLCWHTGSRVTRMLLGLAEVEEVPTLVYSSVEEILRYVWEHRF